MLNRFLNTCIKIAGMITYMNSQVSSVLVLPISVNVTFDTVNEIKVCWIKYKHKKKKKKKYRFLPKAFEAFPLTYQHYYIFPCYWHSQLSRKCPHSSPD